LSDPRAFVPFGAAHLTTLAVVGGLGAGVVALARLQPSVTPLLRRLLAASIAALVAFELWTAAEEHWLTWKVVLPLELCDVALVLAVVMLLVPRRLGVELVYFWAGSGSLVAMLTPDLRRGFPHWEFVVFFGLHGLVLASAMLLVFGLGLHPRRGAPLRVLGVTAGWTAFVGFVNLLLGTNFMYLRRKPPVATPLDWMGPWPVYIAVGGALAFVLFVLLSLPFAAEWRREARD
jgi:hypothetical integral membrane protein (TIGR02206 family)